MSLRSEEDDNGVKQPDERPWRNPFEELLLVPNRVDGSYAEPCQGRGPEWDAEEDTDTSGNCCVRDGNLGAPSTDHLYEQHRQWRV